MAIRDISGLGIVREGYGEEAVFLKGRPPMGEFLGFVKHHTTDGAEIDISELSEEWRLANDHVKLLELSEAGLADKIAMTDPPNGLAQRCKRLLADDVVRASFGIVPTTVGMVELDRVVVFQKFINLEHVRRIQGKVGPKPTPEEIFDLCLGNDEQTPVESDQVAPNTWVFTSQSNDLRVLEVASLGPKQISGHPWTGYPASVMGLAVGYGTNKVSAIRIGTRLVLNNGSHRAYALRDLGVKQVPCLIQNVTRREELEVIGNELLVKHADYYVSAPRPALLKDYFDDELRRIVRIPRRRRQIKVTVSVEMMDLSA